MEPDAVPPGSWTKTARASCLQRISGAWNFPSASAQALTAENTGAGIGACGYAGIENQRLLHHELRPRAGRERECLREVRLRAQESGLERRALHSGMPEIEVVAQHGVRERRPSAQIDAGRFEDRPEKLEALMP